MPEDKQRAIEAYVAAQTPKPSRPGRWRFGWLGLGVVAVLVYLAIALLNPWALHIGGRSTPLMFWTGTGKLVTSSGTYPLLVTLYPSPHGSTLRLDGLRPISGLHGQARLCTPRGSEVLSLTGTIYGGWRSTDGALMEFRLLEWNSTRDRLLGTNTRSGYIDLFGYWHGPELPMNDRRAWSSPFRSGLKLKDASVTLRWGSKSDFDAACAASRALR
ncbi:MAG: hypothetical protein ACRD8A_12195 [Candidatus Acidiferrales bacterium]